ncbi:minor capsid protein [Aerococcaceae bacterium zg-BR9]|uniref:minor capsid protein n=1 Tax=Aerococcaceae bacterium zg-1292 TaxID=2774330 RepID=UPI00406361AF|nr:minor capsid protein [Aerococcaceae bacterium zg-BR9]
MGGLSDSTLHEPALKKLLETPFNGYNYSEQLWGNTDNLAKDLKKTLERGFVRGIHTREMARELNKRFDVARHRVEMVIRTDGTMIINNSIAQRYKDVGLTYYRILVHLDERTTEICRGHAKENKRYLLSEYKPGITAPPFHYNCRSGIVPDDEKIGMKDVELKLSQVKKKGKFVSITEQAIDKVKYIEIPGYTPEQNRNLQLSHKQLLRMRCKTMNQKK